MEPWMKKIFYIGDIHGHSGTNGVIQKLEDVLSTLTSMGYNPDINKIQVDFWGHQKQHGFKLTDEELAKQKGHMFTHHVHRLLQIARQYPDAYWYSDQVWAILPLYEHVGVEGEESEESDFDALKIK